MPLTFAPADALIAAVVKLHSLCNQQGDPGSLENVDGDRHDDRLLPDQVKACVSRAPSAPSLLTP